MKKLTLLILISAFIVTFSGIVHSQVDEGMVVVKAKEYIAKRNIKKPLRF